MNDSDLRAIWQRSFPADNIRLHLSALHNELNQVVSSVEKEIKARDRREIVASVIGIFIFGYLTYEIPFPISKAACVFGIFWFVFVIYKLKKSQKDKVKIEVSLSLKEQLKSQKTNMELQRKLLLSVPYWYILPPYLMNIFLFIGFENPADYGWDHFLANFFPYDPLEKIFPLVFLTFFYAFIAWMNIKTANGKFKLIIQGIERMEKELEEGNA